MAPIWRRPEVININISIGFQGTFLCLFSWLNESPLQAQNVPETNHEGREVSSLGCFSKDFLHLAWNNPDPCNRNPHSQSFTALHMIVVEEVCVCVCVCFSAVHISCIATLSHLLKCSVPMCCITPLETIPQFCHHHFFYLAFWLLTADVDFSTGQVDGNHLFFYFFLSPHNNFFTLNLLCITLALSLFTSVPSFAPSMSSPHAYPPSYSSSSALLAH